MACRALLLAPWGQTRWCVALHKEKSHKGHCFAAPAGEIASR